MFTFNIMTYKMHSNKEIFKEQGFGIFFKMHSRSLYLQFIKPLDPLMCMEACMMGGLSV